MTKPVTNFRNHPTFKYDSVEYIFNIGSGLYLLTEQEVIEILPDNEIEETNIGEPYQTLVRFSYRSRFENEFDSIDIDPKDLSNLVEILEYVGDGKVFIPENLQKYLKN